MNQINQKLIAVISFFVLVSTTSLVFANPISDAFSDLFNVDRTETLSNEDGYLPLLLRQTSKINSIVNSNKNLGLQYALDDENRICRIFSESNYQNCFSLTEYLDLLRITTLRMEEFKESYQSRYLLAIEKMNLELEKVGNRNFRLSEERSQEFQNKIVRSYQRRFSLLYGVLTLTDENVDPKDLYQIDISKIDLLISSLKKFEDLVIGLKERFEIDSDSEIVEELVSVVNSNEYNELFANLELFSGHTSFKSFRLRHSTFVTEALIELDRSQNFDWKLSLGLPEIISEQALSCVRFNRESIKDKFELFRFAYHNEILSSSFKSDEEQIYLAHHVPQGSDKYFLLDMVSPLFSMGDWESLEFLASVSFRCVDQTPITGYIGLSNKDRAATGKSGIYYRIDDNVYELYDNNPPLFDVIQVIQKKLLRQ